MQHLHILYFFVTVSLGIVSLAINIYIYLKYRVSFLKSFLFFHIAFTLDILFAALLMYISTNVSDRPEYLYIVVYQLAVIMHLLLMFSIPVFLHDICLDKYHRIKNMIFAVVTLLTYFNSQFFWFLSNDEQMIIVSEYIEAIIFVAVVIYAFFIGLFNYKKLQDRLRKKIVQKILILLGVLIPGIIYDSIPHFSRSIIFPQLLYCGFGIIFSYYLLRNYPFRLTPGAGTVEQTDEVFEEEFFKRYNLSQREQEIASLLLKGYKNHKIAETLYIAVTTVKTHIRNMFTKFGVNSRYELLILFTNTKNSLSQAKHSIPSV